MKQIKSLLSNIVGFVILVALVIFVYQNYTNQSVDLTQISKFSKISLDLSHLNLNSLKQMVVSTTENQVRLSTANIVDKQITNWKNTLLKGLINEKMTKDTGKISKKSTGDIKIALLADSHESFDNLRLAVDQINKADDYDFVVDLGDLSRVGEKSQLEKSKEILDLLNLKYYVIAGDHDYWETVSSENFISVFGKDYYSFIKNGWKLIFLDNADIDMGLDTTQFEWLKSELNAMDSKYRVIFVHIPLYSTHSERRVMGGQINVENQKQEILKLAREKSVRAIVAGDQHYFNVDIDPEVKNLKHIVDGALTNDRNLQPARYGVLQLKQNGEVEVKDIKL